MENTRKKRPFKFRFHTVERYVHYFNIVSNSIIFDVKLAARCIILSIMYNRISVHIKNADLTIPVIHIFRIVKSNICLTIRVCKSC